MKALGDRAASPKSHPGHLGQTPGIQHDHLHVIQSRWAKQSEDEDAVLLVAIDIPRPGDEDGLGDKVSRLLPRRDVPAPDVDFQDLKQKEETRWCMTW